MNQPSTLLVRSTAASAHTNSLRSHRHHCISLTHRSPPRRSLNVDPKGSAARPARGSAAPAPAAPAAPRRARPRRRPARRPPRPRPRPPPRPRTRSAAAPQARAAAPLRPARARAPPSPARAPAWRRRAQRVSSGTGSACLVALLWCAAGLLITEVQDWEGCRGCTQCVGRRGSAVCGSAHRPAGTAATLLQACKQHSAPRRQHPARHCEKQLLRTAPPQPRPAPDQGEAQRAQRPARRRICQPLGLRAAAQRAPGRRRELGRLRGALLLRGRKRALRARRARERCAPRAAHDSGALFQQPQE